VALYATFASSHRVMLFLMVASLPIVLRDMVRLTHQVAGPLVRFRNTLQQLAQGQNVEQVKLREGDLLTEFQDSFNQFLASERRQQGWPIDHAEQPETTAQESQCLAEVASLQAELSTADRSPTVTAKA
jgi:regulator of protease activity HflC (stomatin/prohibitin superfamily)